MKLPKCVSRVTLDRDPSPWPYPPLGFVAIAEHALGNGDTFGLYWSVGRENEEPIVAEVRHDEGMLVPAFSNLGAFLAATEGLDEDAVLEPPSLIDDPKSPCANLDAAREAVRMNQPETALLLAERALELLPEYGAALAVLTVQRLRLGYYEAAWESALRMVRAPPCLTEPQMMVRAWQRMRTQEGEPDFARADGAWHHRHALRRPLGNGGKDISAAAALSTVIEADIAAGETVRAILAIQTYAELMEGETVSFRERAGYDGPAFRARAIALSEALPGGPRVLET